MDEKPTEKTQEEAPKASSNASNTEHDEDVDLCSCGYDRNHYMVSAVPTYTAWGTFWITLMGVSATPIRIDFRCRICGDVFDFIHDPQELKNYL